MCKSSFLGHLSLYKTNSQASKMYFPLVSLSFLDSKRKTTSLLDGYVFPVIVSAGIAGVIVLITMASICIVKRQRMRRNQDVKKRYVCVMLQ